MNRGVEEVFFSKVSGNFFLEIFEKSIDKHKIDAILNAPSFFKRPFWGCLTVGGSEPEDSTEESGMTIPIQGNPMRLAGSFHALMCMEGNGARTLCALCRGCSLKSVE